MDFVSYFLYGVQDGSPMSHLEDSNFLFICKRCNFLSHLERKFVVDVSGWIECDRIGTSHVESAMTDLFKLGERRQGVSFTVKLREKMV